VSDRLRLKVAGTGSYLPSEVIPNSFFENRDLYAYDGEGDRILYDQEGNKVLPRRVTSDKIYELTGIRERRKSAKDEFPSDMGIIAAKRAMENAGVEADSLAGIIFATVTEDSNCPSAAVKVAKGIGAKRCFAYDVANACAGLPEVIIQANSRFQLTQLNSRTQLNGRNYLCICAEAITKMTDYTDINSTLFGDGTGAVLLTPTEENIGVLGEVSGCDPFEGKDKLIFRDKEGYIRMPDGRRVFREAIPKMVEASVEVKRQASWERANVYIPHQANERIIYEVEKRISENGSIVFRNIESYGNMSSATCAVALDCALRNGTIKVSDSENKGSKVVVVSFGGGLVWSAVPIQF